MPRTAPIVSRLAGTCPVCEAQHKVTTDDVRAVLDLPTGPRPLRIVHHGFERPGDGQIHGDCWGVGAEPYEVSADGTRAYLVVVQRSLAFSRLYLGRLQAGDVRSLHELVWAGIGRDKQVVDVVAPESWTPGMDVDWGTAYETDRVAAAALSKWIDRHRDEVRGTERKISKLEEEVTRLVCLIDGWTARPVLTIEELEAPKAAEKAARKQARVDALAAKLAKKIAFYQGRVDSGVRQRKPALIADAFEAAQRSLRNDFDFAREAAVPAVGRDNVFAAFGLDVRADARDEPNRATLSCMTDTRYAWGKPLAWPSALT